MSELDYVTRVKDLENELEEKKKLLHLAGEFGNRLLENNSELNGRLESSAAEFSARIEHLEQECHSFRLQLDCKAKLEQNQAYELEMQKESLQKDLAKKLQDVEKNYSKKLDDSTKQVGDLEQRLNEFQLVETQLQEKIERLETELRRTQEQLQNKAANETMSYEMSLLQKEIHHLQDVKFELESLLNDSKAEIQRLKFTQDCLGQTIEQLKQQMEDKNEKILELHTAIETLREEASEINLELAALKNQDVDMKIKGNSLFGEVEDCRLEFEKNLITLKVNHDTLKQQHSFTQQQLQKLKMQMATLLMMSTSRVDDIQMQKLGEELSQSRSEVQALRDKVKKLENQKFNTELSTAVSENSSDVDTQAQYLKEMIKVLRLEKEDLCKELQTVNFQRLAHEDRLLQCERKLYSAEASLNQTNGENMILRVKLEDLRIKYQPDEYMKGKQNLAAYKGHVEKIPLPSEDDNKDKLILKEKYINLPKHSTKQSSLHVGQKDSFIKPVELPQEEKPLRSQDKKRVCIADTVTLLDDGGDLEHKKIKSETENELPVVKSKGRRVYVEPIHCSAETSECKQQ